MKNIVIFSDGTGQKGGTDHNTNVYKVFNLILDRSSKQISFYDPGIGTGLRKVTGNVMGRGFSKNILQCYQFIFENYEQGDKIYLFGFSRGAATVRSLAGFIHHFGILPRSRGDLIEKAWKIYKITNPDKRKKKADKLFENNHTMWAHIEYLGVWDTVAALGLPNTPFEKFSNWIVPNGFHDFSLSGSVRHAYHALAIDDVRRNFHPIYFDNVIEANQKMEQVWFMGMHTDVGGGYEEHGLSDIALEWMVQKAVKHGLNIYNKPNRPKPICKPNADGTMHDARDKRWKKFAFKKRTRKWVERFGSPVVHESVLQRTKDINNGDAEAYKPWILKHDPSVAKWTCLDDWMTDPEFEKVKENLGALKGWIAT
jgi:uncharacterized protein (DUF2235 family)